MRPKVSIIIPVYNVAPYLEECLASVLSQTLKEIEIICINDGSTDSSGEILAQFSKKDNRIKVLNQKNKGAGPARNKGILKASGEYLICLDSDDFFAPQMLEQMYLTAKEEKSDRVVCGFYIYDNRQKKTVERVLPFVPENFSSPYLTSKVRDKVFNMAFGVAWIELYKTSLIQKNFIRFGSWAYSEDSFFVWQAVACSQKTSFIQTPFVYYRFWNEKQATLRLNDKEKSFGLKKTFSNLYQVFQKKGIYEKYKKAFALRLYESIQYEVDNGWDEEKVTTFLSSLPKAVQKDYADFLAGYKKRKRTVVVLS